MLELLEHTDAIGHALACLLGLAVGVPYGRRQRPARGRVCLTCAMRGDAPPPGRLDIV